jgi:cytochrome P450
VVHRVSTPFTKTEYYDRFRNGGKFPPGVFTFQNPKDHSARRRLLGQPLSETALKTMEPTVNTNIFKTIDGIARELKETGTADILKWFTFMATDVIGELTFAESFRMLDQAKVSSLLSCLVCTLMVVLAKPIFLRSPTVGLSVLLLVTY